MGNDAGHVTFSPGASSPISAQTEALMSAPSVNLVAAGLLDLSPSEGPSSMWSGLTPPRRGEAEVNDDGEVIVPTVDPAAVAAALYAKDRAAQALGIEILEVRAGYSRLVMPVQEDMVNGHGICHGGLIFALADTAFAYACNSGNMNSVAAGAAIDFMAPARLGELLTAEANEHWTGGRAGITDVIVTGAGGRRIAVFRGRSARIGGFVVEPRS
jgi:acyl-CoA thioesterase